LGDEAMPEYRAPIAVPAIEERDSKRFRVR
jgi:hypothetical protein